jgi:hypothetical protein
MSNSNEGSPVDGNHDQVVFENVADQYVKGENVTAHFTILHDIKVNSKEDHIGLLRVCKNLVLLFESNLLFKFRLVQQIFKNV